MATYEFYHSRDRISRRMTLSGLRSLEAEHRGLAATNFILVAAVVLGMVLGIAGLRVFDEARNLKSSFAMQLRRARFRSKSAAL